MKITYIVLAVLLLLCLAPMPYGYYQLVRFVAMVAFALMAYRYYGEKKNELAITFGALTLLFQPFVKVALGRIMWNVVDVIVAILLIALYLKDGKEG
jgi:hypothetical protein